MDVTPLKAGMAQAASVVDESTTQMKADFEALQARVVALEAEIAQLHAQLARTPPSPGIHKFTNDVTEARHASHLLGDELGVHVPRAVQSFLAHMDGVGPLLAKAFTPLAVIALLDVIKQIPDKIGEATTAIAGFGEAAQKTYKEVLDANRALILRNLDLAEKMDAVGVIGKSGLAKYALEQKNAEAAAKRMAAELGRTNLELQRTEELVTHLEAKSAWYNDPLAGLTGVNRELKEAQENLERLKKTRDELEPKLRGKGVVDKTRGAEEMAAEHENALAAARAAADARKGIDDAYVAYYESGLKQMFTAGQITLEEEVAGEKAAVAAKLEAEREYARQRIAILEAEGKTGKDVAPQIKALNAQLEELTAQSRAKINQIDSAAYVERKRLADDFARAQIEGQKAVALALAASEEEAGRLMLQSDAIEIDDETAILKAGENKKYEAQKKALEQRIAIARTEGEKGKAAVEQYSRDIEALSIQHNAALFRIEAEGANKKRQLAKSELETHIQSLNDGVEAARAAYEREVSALEIQRTQKHLTLAQYTSDVMQAAQKEYQAQYDALQQEVRAVQDAANKKIITEEEKSKRLEALWKEEARLFEQTQREILRAQQDAAKIQEQSIDHVANKWGQDFARMANEVITHKESIGRAVLQMMGQIELQMIDQGIAKVVSKWATWMLQLITQHASWLAQLLGIQVAGDTQRVAAGAVTATQEVGQNAAVSGAAAFASVMEALPFPENIATAPEIMAAAVSTTLSNLSLLAFEKGGVVPGIVGAVLHPGEMVLPAHLSNFIQRGASLAGGVAAAPSLPAPEINHHHYNIRIDGATSKGDIETMVHEAILPAIRRAHRAGSLPRE